MKVLKIILLILAIIIGGYLIWMATLDGKFDVKRSATIEATPDQVYAVVSDLSTWPTWGVWFDKDTTMKTYFNEQTQGLNAYYNWEGNDGKGRLEIVEVEPGKSMKTQIDFEGMGSSNGYWTFEEVDGGTKVTWGMSGKLPFLLRSVAAGMDDALGADFEGGLEKLKKFVQTDAVQAATSGYEFKEIKMNPMDVYYVRHEIAMADINSELYAAGYTAIAGYLAEDAANMTGMPMTIYQEWNEEEQTTVMDLAMPCMSEKPGNDQIMKGQSYEGLMLKTIYYGAYDGMKPVYEAADAYINANGYEQNGPVMEVYVTDPGTQPDTSQWATEVYWAVLKK